MAGQASLAGKTFGRPRSTWPYKSAWLKTITVAQSQQLVLHLWSLVQGDKVASLSLAMAYINISRRDIGHSPLRNAFMCHVAQSIYHKFGPLEADNKEAWKKTSEIVEKTLTDVDSALDLAAGYDPYLQLISNAWRQVWCMFMNHSRSGPMDPEGMRRFKKECDEKGIGLSGVTPCTIGSLTNDIVRRALATKHPPRFVYAELVEKLKQVSGPSGLERAVAELVALLSTSAT